MRCILRENGQTMQSVRMAARKGCCGRESASRRPLYGQSEGWAASPERMGVGDLRVLMPMEMLGLPVLRGCPRRLCRRSGEKEGGAFVGGSPRLAMGDSATQGSLFGGGGGQEVEHGSGTGMGVGNRVYPSAAAATTKKGGVRAVQREEYASFVANAC